MKIPRDYLFDMTPLYTRRIASNAAARNAIGEVAEEFACAVLCLNPLRVDGRKEICPDAVGRGYEWEIKSVGKNNTGLIYKWRIEKELRLIGREYQYCFVQHTCPISVRSGEEIVDHFRKNVPTLQIISAGEVWDRVCAVKPPRSFRLFTGQKAEELCATCGGNPQPEHADPTVGDGRCIDCGAAPAKERRRPHGSQRKGYVLGGWQFSLNALPFTSTRTMRIYYGGVRLDVSVRV